VWQENCKQRRSEEAHDIQAAKGKIDAKFFVNASTKKIS
jgi:hypothetical protein